MVVSHDTRTILIRDGEGDEVVVDDDRLGGTFYISGKNGLSVSLDRDDRRALIKFLSRGLDD